MAGVNKAILIGNLGKDPEIRKLENGATVANFPIATSESYTNRQGERVEQTEWHNIVLWRGLAEIAEKYLKKGSQVFIEGKIRSRQYEDREGNTRYITEIVGDNMTMLSRAEQGSGNSGNYGNAAPAQNTVNEQNLQATEEEDDLPF